MNQEQQQLLRRAESSLEEAINLAILIEDGNLGLPVAGLLHLYALLVKWRKHYDEEAEICRKNGNADLAEACKVSVSLVNSHMQCVEDIFRNWEILIRDYFMSLSASVEIQVLEDAAIFAEMADNNEAMALHDWKSLLAEVSR